VHKKETDEMQGSNINHNNNSILSYSQVRKVDPQQELEEPQTAPLSLVTAPTPPSDNSPQKSPESSLSHTEEEDEEDVEDEETEDDEAEEGEEEEPEVRDRNDDQRYEPVTEEFLFEGDMIKPCYCVLPFVTDEEVESITRRNISVG